jgi:hypothetical protein
MFKSMYTAKKMMTQHIWMPSINTSALSITFQTVNFGIDFVQEALTDKRQRREKSVATHKMVNVGLCCHKQRWCHNSG